MSKPAGIYKRVCPFCEGELEFPLGKGSPLVYCPKCKVHTGAKEIPIFSWDGENFIRIKFDGMESFVFR